MHLISKFSEDGWNVAFRRLPAATILNERNTPFSLIPNTWRSWAADPFVFDHNGTTYIFAEIFDYWTRRGAIGYTCYVNGKWKRWKTVIREPFHMSYPNVFFYDGQIYMVPETSEAKELRLYRAVSFPNIWQLEKVLAADVEWVDTTFFECENCCYAITTDISNLNDQKDILLQFDNQWNLMSRNVVSEKETGLSRSAGNFLRTEQGMVRVTQDCRGHYGRALVFSRFLPDSLIDKGMGDLLLQLKPEDIPVQRAGKWTGVHTYNSAESIEVVDIERRHYNLIGLIGRLVWRIKMRLAR